MATARRLGSRRNEERDATRGGGGHLALGDSLRVAHLLHSFGTGGLEKGIATVVSNASSGIEHVVVCFTVSGASERLLPPGTRVVELGKLPGNSPSFVWKLSRVLKRLRPGVVHTRNWSGMDGIVAARLAGIRGVVHGEHGWGVDDPEGLSPKRIRIRRVLARWVREYTCVSAAMVPWLEDTVRVGRPVSQIYNGVDTDRYRPGPDAAAARGALGLCGHGPVLGVVGRLDPIKDHRTLFRSFEALRQKHPDVVLLVVGDGPERRALEGSAGQGVRFLGNRPDVPALLRALDVFVLPSLNEGISNTILEAMATGLPVVASQVGGNPELVLDGITGTLFPPSDEEALTRALLGYVENPELRLSHGRTGRQRVLQDFSIDRMVRGYEDVYRRVAKAGGGLRKV